MQQPQTRDGLIASLRYWGKRVANLPLHFGGTVCCTHVVVVEGEFWRVRRLVTDRARADANFAAHGIYMPEEGEMVPKPGPDVVLEATSLEGLVAALKSAPWPLP